ncbi:MAG: hypothetical protein JWN40_5730 [Phycisphaerales bacterium]|nr:hypothetical protein [Phycisphaerales bacterium]
MGGSQGGIFDTLQHSRHRRWRKPAFDQQANAGVVGGFFLIIACSSAVEGGNAMEVSAVKQVTQLVGDGGGELGVSERIQQSAGNADSAVGPAIAGGYV